MEEKFLTPLSLYFAVIPAQAGIPRHSAFLLPSGEKVRMRGSSCATLTLTLSLKGEGILALHSLP